MMALYGEGHAHSQKAWDTLFEAVTEMNKVADEYKQKYQLNFSVLATPAEGLSRTLHPYGPPQIRHHSRRDGQ